MTCPIVFPTADLHDGGNAKIINVDYFWDTPITGTLSYHGKEYYFFQNYPVPSIELKNKTFSEMLTLIGSNLEHIDDISIDDSSLDKIDEIFPQTHFKTDVASICDLTNCNPKLIVVYHTDDEKLKQEIGYLVKTYDMPNKEVDNIRFDWDITFDSFIYLFDIDQESWKELKESGTPLSKAKGRMFSKKVLENYKRSV